VSRPAVHSVFLDDASWRPGARVPLPAAWINPPKSNSQN